MPHSKLYAHLVDWIKYILKMSEIRTSNGNTLVHLTVFFEAIPTNKCAICMIQGHDHGMLPAVRAPKIL